MTQALKHTIKNHYSLGIMIFGSVSVFIANILFRDLLSPEHYYKYSILIIFIALMNSFGLFGLEQVFVRLTIIKNDVLEVSKKNVQAIGIIALVNSFVFTWVLKWNYRFEDSFLLLVLMSMPVICLVFFYNFFRLNSNFVIAQLASNSWKIYLGLGVLFTYFFNLEINFDSFLIGLITALLLTVLCCVLLTKKIKVVFVDLISLREMLKLAFQFFISLLTLSFIAQSDKLIVEEFFGAEKFIDYFYLANLFLFPFSFIQSYIGFKEIIVMKKDHNYNLLKASIRVFAFAIVFSILLVGIVLALAKFSFIKIDLYANSAIILLFLLTGVLRLVYAIYSSYFSCFANTKDVKWVNTFSIISSLVLLYIVSNINLNVNVIALFLASLWMIRLNIWVVYSFKLRKRLCDTN